MEPAPQMLLRTRGPFGSRISNYRDGRGVASGELPRLDVEALIRPRSRAG